MKRKCSHMWKWSILRPFHLPPSEFQLDQTGNGIKIITSAKSFCSVSPQLS